MAEFVFKDMIAKKGLENEFTHIVVAIGGHAGHELLKEYNEAAVQNIIKIPKLDYDNLDEKSIKMLVNLLIDHVSVTEKTVDIF